VTLVVWGKEGLGQCCSLFILCCQLGTDDGEEASMDEMGMGGGRRGIPVFLCHTGIICDLFLAG
jgi:hypothetical protein